MALHIKHLPSRGARKVALVAGVLALVAYPLSIVVSNPAAHALMAPGSVVVNEFSANGSSDWVELYNTTDSAIDLTGWSLHDETSEMKALSGSLAARAFLPVEVGNRLNANTDSIVLASTPGQNVDSVAYTITGAIPYPSEGKTTARTTNGGSQWQTGVPTKGVSNEPDVTAPVVAITAPTSLSVNGTVTVSGTVTDENPSHYYFVVKDSAGIVKAGPGTVRQAAVSDWQWNTTGLSEGDYTIQLEARDQAGNKDGNSVAKKSVTIDRTAPTVEIVSPATGQVVGGPALDIVGTVQDKNGVKEYRYQLLDSNKDNTLGNSTIGGNGAVENGLLGTVDVSGLASGNYYVRVWATDQAGNVSSPQYAMFSVDHTAPIVTIGIASSQAPSASTPIDLHGTVDDPSSIAKLTLYIDDEEVADITAAMTTSGDWSYTLQSGLARGGYTISVVAVDHFGNASTLATSPASAADITVSAFVPRAGSSISPAVTSRLTDRFPAISTPENVTVSTPAIVDENSQSDEGVLGLETVKELDLGKMAEAPAIAASENGWRFFGIAWYWWTALLAGLAIVAWRVAALRRDNEQVL